MTALREKIANKPIGKIIHRILVSLDMATLSIRKNKRAANLIKKIIKEDNEHLLYPSGLFMIYKLALRQRSIEGDFAEVGVYKGTSAKAICEAKGNKYLYLFDTFNGLPKSDKEKDSKVFSEKMYAAKYKYVKQRLSKYENVHIYRGLFPKTAGPIKNKKFSFVHIDVDIYQSTKDRLEFFYKRMQKGGIILSHDYNTKGVKKTFNEFFN